ncbi:S41 family peptidase [Chitinophaga japonensis]|uniref:Peptidase S41-like protein n=1 Tax=Chitinophaga japonensis TaxID=104662 RepID=A0A562TFJ6_CHIJA|nr:S41 family peptidase [Chitinophaga japonensis]TWI91750.1 peptidase S41-like protein [Chitinophaga japonensis]
MFTICRKTAWAAAICLFILGACKKDHGPDITPITDDTGKPTVNDSMYFIFKDEYLWNDVIPDSATFKPNSYSNLNDMFNALISYKRNARGEYMDKYGFLDNGAVAGEIGEGIAGDFGLEIDYNTANDLRVIYVYEGSPAYQQGIRRTWQITAINGNSNLTYDGSQGVNVTRIRNAVYYSDNVTLTLKKPDGNSTTVTLNTASYNINPVLHYSTLNLGSRKVGYLVFNTFIALDKAQPKIDAAFDKFISDGITDLVVDFRYNGGGSVETAEYLANLIAPAAVGSGKTTLMYKETFNADLTNHQYSRYLANKKVPGYNLSWGDVFDDWVDNPDFYFDKQKSLDISSVAFIGSYSTASASELVINILQPYMNVELVGDTTYGKPVGFVGITIGGYDMYAVSIWSKNAQNNGDYFDGMFPTDAPVADNERYEDYSKDWGSTSEIYLRRALRALGIPESELGRRAPGTESLRKLMNRNPMPDLHFKGMIETRRSRLR